MHSYCLLMKNDGVFDTTTAGAGGMDVVSEEARRLSLGWAALSSQPVGWKTHPSAPALRTLVKVHASAQMRGCRRACAPVYARQSGIKD